MTKSRRCEYGEGVRMKLGIGPGNVKTKGTVPASWGRESRTILMSVLPSGKVMRRSCQWWTRLRRCVLGQRYSVSSKIACQSIFCRLGDATIEFAREVGTEQLRKNKCASQPATHPPHSLIALVPSNNSQPPRSIWHHEEEEPKKT